MAGSIAKAYVQVIPSAEGIKGKLSGMLGGEVGAAGNSAGQTFGTSMIGKIKGLIAVAGIGKLLGESLQAGGAMQQSLGGIETLFKDSADTVIANAEKAYKTAGMSANQYMESVTSFSASLLQGLAGDTEKAASVADMAMTDMSDNANKMGTSMESIQNAYQGFAKQNYTMLDNLKLGYGGTKTEMERLLKDAQKISGIKYDISNLSDVYSAIHVIQGELGITGTTAKEAASTFSGSISSMKAALSDVLANLSLGRDIGPSLQALQETFFTFFTGNLIPMVGNIMGTLPEVLSNAFSMGIQAMNLAATNAESIVQTGLKLVTGIATSIVSAAPYLVEAALNLIKALSETIIKKDWGQVAKDTIGKMRNSIDLAANEILGTDQNIVQAMLNAIASRLPDILAKGGEMLNTLVSGILSALPSLTSSALQTLTSFVNQLIAGLPQVLNTGTKILTNVVQGIQSALPKMIESAGTAVGTLLKGIVNNLPQIIEAGFNLIVSLVSGISNAAPKILTAAWNALQNVVSAAKEIDWAYVGNSIVSGVISGIAAMGDSLWTAAERLAKKALNAMKSALGIRSPSRVMRDEIGKWIPSGVAVGIQANTKPLTDAMHDLSTLSTDTLQADLQLARVAMNMPVPAETAVTNRSTGSKNDIFSLILEKLEDIEESVNAKGNALVRRAEAEIASIGEIYDALSRVKIGEHELFDMVWKANAERSVAGMAQVLVPYYWSEDEKIKVNAL